VTVTHVTDSIAAYALGCLDEEERRQVETHLPGCPACQAELRAFQQVTEELPLAAGAASPPRRLKQAILHKASSQARPSQKAGILERIRRLARSARPVWTAVSVLLIIGLAISTFAFWRQAQNPPAASLEHFRVVNLTSPAKTPDVTAILIISENGKFGTLVTDGLGLLGKEQQYQLWLIKNGNRTSGGVFSVNEGGYAAMEIHSGVPLSDFDSFGVTIEPAGGSPAPTGEKVLGSG
jgi:anti-sigma-K factor RskA